MNHCSRLPVALRPRYRPARLTTHLEEDDIFGRPDTTSLAPPLAWGSRIVSG